MEWLTVETSTAQLLVAPVEPSAEAAAATAPKDRAISSAAKLVRIGLSIVTVTRLVGPTVQAGVVA